MALQTSSVGSLTTTFTPTWTGDCDSIFSAANSVNSWLQRGPPAPEEQISCLPPEWTDDVVPYWSPGLCPSGFTMSNNWMFTSGTSTATCCPVNYSVRETVAAVDKNICASDIESTWVSVITYAYFGTESPTTPSTVTHSFRTGDYVGAKGVVIQRQASDPTWDLDSSSPPSPTGPGTSESNSGGGLSIGTKAGIGVGVSIGVLLIIAIIFAAFKIGSGRRREQHQHEMEQLRDQHQHQQFSPSTGASEAVKSGQQMAHGWTPSQAYQHQPIHEISGQMRSPPTELDSRNQPPNELG